MIWCLLAKLAARPAVGDWLIARAKKTPYTPIHNHGDLYMERYWLFNAYPLNEAERNSRGWLRNNLPSVRLHKIVRPDADRECHDHPWDARTIIIKNWYRERRLAGWANHVSASIVRVAGDTATLKFGEYHTITEVAPEGVWTIFITWEYQGTWGFLVNGKKVSWREYLNINQGEK